MNKFGSLCPTLKATDILGDKWTLLILRELFMGAHRYNNFQNALPRISPTVLSNRLKTMEKNGLIIHKKDLGKNRGNYYLTQSGKELAPIMDQLARWGLRWARDQLCDIDIDAGTFMWDFHRTLRIESLPDGQHVFCVILSDQPDATKWWMIAKSDSVDLCNEDPGYDVSMYITCTLRSLAEVWMGEKSLAAYADREIKFNGAGYLRKNVMSWFPLSRYVDVQAVSS
ncbi:winged helix-turn-helix transcriptional regulator [Aliiglaciecola sp. M165]|uniref:winged helix-turn-helix transcriptional regulator n=1 Tax=Aliiglaciecola sp. M165 TaxID=2593649 RepID=UPI00117C8F9F|nr:helix-turn-helix domain-containing protein [Aliiglaciecola sp. M165]TRY31328.1 helix-turn-helix transcriptional regulator [Aliiglaciecola sp. M165]